MKTQQVIAALIAKNHIIRKDSFYKILSTLISNNLFSLMGETYSIEQVDKEKPHIKDLLNDLAYLLSNELIESRHAKDILEKAWSKEWYEWDICWYLSDSKLLEEAGEDELRIMVKEILDNEPKALEDLKNGKKKVMGHIIGQIMKKTKGKANPQQITKIIESFLLS